MNRHLNFNTFILAILTICTGAIAFFVKEIVFDVKRNNDILVEVRTNQQNVMERVKSLEGYEKSQDARIEGVETSVEVIKSKLK